MWAWEHILDCGPCGEGHFLVSDTPWVNLMTEIYLASGPETKVILSRRDAASWAHSRGSHVGQQVFVCRDTGNQTTTTMAALSVPAADPFSYSHCQGRTATTLDRLSEHEAEDAFMQYVTHVHKLVRPNYLLDLNLFSSEVLQATGRASDVVERDWSNPYGELIGQFLAT